MTDNNAALDLISWIVLEDYCPLVSVLTWVVFDHHKQSNNPSTSSSADISTTSGHPTTKPPPFFSVFLQPFPLYLCPLLQCLFYILSLYLSTEALPFIQHLCFLNSPRNYLYERYIHVTIFLIQSNFLVLSIFRFSLIPQFHWNFFLLVKAP
jgi:hypothetical protein